MAVKPQLFGFLKFLFFTNSDTKNKTNEIQNVDKLVKLERDLLHNAETQDSP